LNGYKKWVIRWDAVPEAFISGSFVRAEKYQQTAATRAVIALNTFKTIAVIAIVVLALLHMSTCISGNVPSFRDPSPARTLNDRGVFLFDQDLFDLAEVREPHVL
jgi:hypothetical protein